MTTVFRFRFLSLSGPEGRRHQFLDGFWLGLGVEPTTPDKNGRHWGAGSLLGASLLLVMGGPASLLVMWSSWTGTTAYCVIELCFATFLLTRLFLSGLVSGANAISSSSVRRCRYLLRSWRPLWWRGSRCSRCIPLGRGPRAESLVALALSLVGARR